jgi:pimeloyl-ACP methyl ester carboxylesterase
MVGTPVFYFHGFPASRLEGELMHGAAARQRVRLVAVDRPGFGYSDFRPQTLADWPSESSRSPTRWA